MTENYDVVVVGSGGAGCIAALRAHDLGFKVLIIEKAHKYGGTTATSGGVLWLPNNGMPGSGDSREESLKYLNAVAKGQVRQERLEAYVDNTAEMLRYLKSIGVEYENMPWPDYFPEAPGSRIDRCVVFPKFDGRRLGNDYVMMREQFTRFKLLNRYAMDFSEMNTISSRARGYIFTVLKVIARYWLDFQARMLSRRDRWLSLGAAVIGALREKILARGIEIRLSTKVDKLIYENDRVVGVQINRFGKTSLINAKHGVINCAGGFEWSQPLRNRFMTIPGSTRWSSTPEDANSGEVLEAGLAIGANTEFMETGQWVPTMFMPIKGVSNFEEIHQAVFDVGRPHGVCVNRNGHRFVNESCAYDRFGNAMMDDQLKTGANTPCWLVFDAQFRQKFTAGGFMPTAIMPDSRIPPDWWDHYLFKAGTIAELARKIDVDPATLEDTVARMNDYARTGIDPEYGRGSDIYDKAFGDMTVRPNPCLGPITQAPYYAISVNLGDLGTKGGMKADARARVLDTTDRPIHGLYAAGNAAGTPFGNCYPGAGGTIGPGVVFGYVAANDIYERSRANAPR